MNIFSELIGTALLHFIWQGALVALFLALVLFFLKKANSQIRYSISWVALIIMIMLPAQSIWKEFRAIQADRAQVAQSAIPEVDASASTDSGDDTSEAIHSPGTGETSTSETPTRDATEANKAVEMLYAIKPYLAFFWAVGVLVMSVRLFGGWFVVSRLRTRDSEPVGKELQILFDRLIEQAGIRGEVLIRQTKTCTEVLLIGWIKPAVLLPLSVVSELSTDHLEAIIAHEIAHVKRYDYILAGVQAVIETFLFFHPAVWWVSRQVRIEREHCCDDLAVEIINDRARYARALYELEVKRNTFLRVALSANDGNLLSRISRLAAAPVNNKNTYRRTSFSSILVAVLIGMSLVIGSCTDLSIDTENPVSVGVEFEIPPALESLVVLDDREGAVEYLHKVRNEGDIEDALEMTLGAYAQSGEELRRSLMFVMAHIDSREADDALVQIAETDPSMEVRQGAIRSINIRIVDDPEIGNELVRGLNVPPGTVYKYPAMSLRRERALTSALQHVVRDNEQGPQVRTEALRALTHREDLGSFFNEVITASTEDWFTLDAINTLELEEQFIPRLLAIYQTNPDPGTKGFALRKLGDAGAAEALPLMFEALLAGTDGFNLERRGQLPPGLQLSWAASRAMRDLYKNVGPGRQESLLNEVMSMSEDFISRSDQEAQQGFSSDEAKKERYHQLTQVYGMLRNLRGYGVRSPELDNLAERAKQVGR